VTLEIYIPRELYVLLVRSITWGTLTRSAWPPIQSTTLTFTYWSWRKLFGAR